MVCLLSPLLFSILHLELPLLLILVLSTVYITASRPRIMLLKLSALGHPTETLKCERRCSIVCSEHASTAAITLHHSLHHSLQ